MQYPSTIGEQLIVARRARGVTQSALGKRLGVSQPQISRWEANAYRTAAVERLSEIARALDVEVSLSGPPMAAESGGSYGVQDCELIIGVPLSPSDIVLQRLGVDRDRIAAFCRKWGILEFAVFGSILGPRFGTSSDIDALVRFDPERRRSFADLDDMTAELVSLFGRGVDLVNREVIEQSDNYLRRRAILGESHTLYAA